jgi:hypothetical protein
VSNDFKISFESEHAVTAEEEEEEEEEEVILHKITQRISFPK